MTTTNSIQLNNTEAAIDLIIRKAPELIAVGVTSVILEGLSVTLSASGPATDLRGIEMADSPPPPPQHTDPMQDAATYPGGRVPGFTRPKDGE